VAATLLLATLQNDTGYNLSTVTIAYDFGALVAPGAVIAEEVLGLVTYLSMTGEAGSWQVIPELSTRISAKLTAELNLFSWPPGARCIFCGPTTMAW
jgi:hypothetical protein